MIRVEGWGGGGGGWGDAVMLGAWVPTKKNMTSEEKNVRLKKLFSKEFSKL